MSLSNHEALKLAGCTYRQLDYWARAGYLHPDVTGEGSGIPRQWSIGEVLVAARITRLVDAGIALSIAEQVARRTADRATVEIAPGIHLTITDTSTELQEATG